MTRRRWPWNEASRVPTPGVRYGKRSYLTSCEAKGEQGDLRFGGVEAPGKQDRTPRGRAAQPDECLDVTVGHELEATQRFHEVGTLQPLDALKEGMPFGRAFEPARPAHVEYFLEALGKAPERHTPGRIEHLGAPMRGNREDGTGLSEVVGPGKAPPEGY